MAAGPSGTHWEYILGGGPILQFPDSARPTRGDVLRYYSQYLHTRMSVLTKTRHVSEALFEFYRARDIDTITELGIRKKITSELTLLNRILKFKSKNKNPLNVQIENDFKMRIQEVFPVEKPRAIVLGESSPMNIIEQDESNLDESNLVESMDHDYMEEAIENAPDYDSDDPDFDPSESSAFSKTKKCIPDEVLWKMFKTDISFRMLSEILKLTLSIFHEENNFQISHTQLFKKYQELSATHEKEYKIKLSAQAQFGTICFDHQSLKKLNGKFTGLENRLVVVWHSESVDKLLSVEQIENKSGLQQCLSILRTCNEFDIHPEQIIGFSCDNASPNVGPDNGTCIRLERILEKPILRMMCRHHIMEIMIKDVYRHFFKTTAPTNVFYPLLKENWSAIKEMNFPFDHSCEDIQFEFPEINLNQNQIDTFNELKQRARYNLRSHASRSFIRDDYKEITDLARKYLGDTVRMSNRPNSVPFYALQKPSMARFMGVAINGLKCYLFRGHLDWSLTQNEEIEQNLPWFAAFVAIIYTRFWNKSNILFDAAVNDLDLLSTLEEYAIFDQETAKTAMNAYKRHLCYLSEELVVLSLFSTKISCAEKNEVASRLIEFMDEQLPPREYNSNHIQYTGEVNDWRFSRIVDFIGERSHYLFNLLELHPTFLELDASEWENNENYRRIKTIVENCLTCVNDNTERAISKCKAKCKKQRCRNDNSFRRSMISSYMD